MAHHSYWTLRDEDFDLFGYYPTLHKVSKKLRDDIKVGDLVEVIFVFGDGNWFRWQKANVRVTKTNRKRITGTIERDVYDEQSKRMESVNGESTWRCAKCDFDLCDLCYSSKKIKHEHPLIKTKIPRGWAYCNGDRCVKLKNSQTVSALRTGIRGLWVSESKNGKRIYKKVIKSGEYN